MTPGRLAHARYTHSCYGTTPCTCIAASSDRLCSLDMNAVVLILREIHICPSCGCGDPICKISIVLVAGAVWTTWANALEERS